MAGKFTSKKIFKVFVVIAIATILIIWNPQNFFSKVRGFFIGVTYPVQRVFASGANRVNFLTKVFSSIGEIRKENEQLIEQNLRLKSENLKLADTVKENEILREQLAILPRDKFDLEAAYIIGRDSYNNSSWILVDKGRRNGLENGMSVVVAEGVLVGRVEEVMETTAKIIFITNQIINVNVETMDTRAVGVVRGDYGLGLVMDLVLQTDALKLGDKVVTSDISQNIPRGLLVGEIKEVNPMKNDLFQKAIISSPVDFSKLRFVFIIKNVK
ncbi:MAG: rod shape-determining protein MreC [Candidatus Moraniibacteriota bacterium]